MVIKLKDDFSFVLDDRYSDNSTLIDAIKSEWNGIITNFINEENNMTVVDETKYDIIEKKEAKIARLKLKLNEWVNAKDIIKAILDIYGADLNEKIKKIDEITAELKELEEDPK